MAENMSAFMTCEMSKMAPLWGVGADVGKKMMPPCPALCIHLIEVDSVALNKQLHATSLVCDDCIFLHSILIEEVFGLCPWLSGLGWIVE